MHSNVYYCPKCDRTISRERLLGICTELESKFGKSPATTFCCPVCDTEFIDLDRVSSGGEKHVGDTRKRTD